MPEVLNGYDVHNTAKARTTMGMSVPVLPDAHTVQYTSIADDGAGNTLDVIVALPTVT